MTVLSRRQLQQQQQLPVAACVEHLLTYLFHVAVYCPVYESTQRRYCGVLNVTSVACAVLSGHAVCCRACCIVAASLLIEAWYAAVQSLSLSKRKHFRDALALAHHLCLVRWSEVFQRGVLPDRYTNPTQRELKS
jgi:hypothetical protein